MKLLFYLIIIVLFASCSINGSLQGLYSYFTKVKRQNLEMRIISRDEICCSKDSWNGVIITNGLELKRCLKTKENALVYVWKPNCHGKFCYSLAYLQQYCNSINHELYIVAEYYDYEKMKMNHNLKNNIIGINTKYYKSNLTKKYLKKFMRDLTNKEEFQKNLYLFKYGEFKSSFQTIEDFNANFN